jgi:hypothetical protein
LGLPTTTVTVTEAPGDGDGVGRGTGLAREDAIPRGPVGGPRTGEPPGGP